jgi:hypothetical protein
MEYEYHKVVAYYLEPDGSIDSASRVVEVDGMPYKLARKYILDAQGTYDSSLMTLDIEFEGVETYDYCYCNHGCEC